MPYVPKRHKDLTGCKFGRLTPTKLDTQKSKYGKLYWFCKCDCGKTVSVSRTNLGRSTNSCGCLKAEMMVEAIKPLIPIEASDSAYRRHYLNYKKDSRRRAKRNFELTYEEFYQLVISPCSYCGSNPTTVISSGYKHWAYVNGVDRVDNEKGYTTSNTVSCCKTCNYIKRNMPVSELKVHIAKMHTRINQWP